MQSKLGLNRRVNYSCVYGGNLSGNSFRRVCLEIESRQEDGWAKGRFAQPPKQPLKPMLATCMTDARWR